MERRFKSKRCIKGAIQEYLIVANLDETKQKNGRKTIK